MRVIAGKARRLQLKTVPSDAVRPTTDRIKETLFNILQNDLNEIRFLDLFAGSGAIGIEALSRGAASACFVDNSRLSCDCIRSNLAFTHLQDQAEIFQCDALTALARLAGRDPFQMIYMDPPYHTEDKARVLRYLASTRPSYVNADTLVIAEMALDEDAAALADPLWSIARIKTYKTNKHIFMHLKTEEEKNDDTGCLSGEF